MPPSESNERGRRRRFVRTVSGDFRLFRSRTLGARQATAKRSPELPHLFGGLAARKQFGHAHAFARRFLIIDALRHKPHPTHLSVDQAIEVAHRVKPGKSYFTHVCHELPQAAETDLPPNTFIAYDGLRLEF